MTNNPMNFMTNQFTKWFNLNSGGEKVKRVIVVPCRPEDKDVFRELVDKGTFFFRNCKWGVAIHKDDYYIFQLESDGKEFFLYWNKGFECKNTIEENIGLIEDDCHFLSSLVFYTEFNIQPTGPLNLLEDKGLVYEEELVQILPDLLTLSLEREYASEKFEIKVIRVLLYVELLDRKHATIYERVIELALSLPEKEHDWLYFELIRAIRSKKQDSMYLCLYKMLEFFFPLKNVFNFSSRISYAGSTLQLLEHCRSELNWNVNHNYGLRAAKDYASHAFCSHLDLDMSILDGMPDGDKKNNKIDQFKSDGLEKLSTLRHALTHQNFKDLEVAEEEISKCIIAIIIFLTEAFAEYCRRINK
ncbi:hypothetical protein [Klebsiella michiganensis]|uniref:hypothetical protein n=2 Tax=Klebsiella/Raoultella group TaxID=2890311 RepID=UPI000516334B|nr:hypothetical protein [Klebsiella michiganensis]